MPEDYPVPETEDPVRRADYSASDFEHTPVCQMSAAVVDGGDFDSSPTTPTTNTQVASGVMSPKEKNAAAWKARWREAVDGSVGIAPYLEGGAKYVEEIRRRDAERLSRFDNSRAALDADLRAPY